MERALRVTARRPAPRVYRFRVVLRDVRPPIWRSIEVPETYTFWDLHVAIQDAMGWSDYHLHVFRAGGKGAHHGTQIGIPDDDPFEGALPTVAGWEVPIARYFTHPGVVVQYDYDFGDGWEHDVTLEVVVPHAPNKRYPVCVAGARACPPEDCGGIGGFEHLFEVMRDPDHEEYEQTLQWLGGRFDPEAFDPRRVTFDDPAKRWNLAFGRTAATGTRRRPVTKPVSRRSPRPRSGRRRPGR